MKKGLLTVLAASLVFVGCQNYDDQFDDLNAQISALKSQVDGLSSLSAQVASLSGTISGLQSGIASAASSSELSALSASLASLQSDLDAVTASIAGTATAAEVTALQSQVTAIQADLTDLLDTSNIYSSDVNVSNATTLNSALALGDKINVLNATFNVTAWSGMDYTKMQTLVDRLNTVTGNVVYNAFSSTGTEVTFNNLVSAGDITVKQPGGYQFPKLANAAVISLNDEWETTVTTVSLPLLTTATGLRTDTTDDTVEFTYATSVDLGSMAVAPNATSGGKLAITTKKDATLDIGSLVNKDANGDYLASYDLDITGPASVTIGSASDNFASTGLPTHTKGISDGNISLTTVGTAAVHNFRGTLDVNAGVKDLTVNNGVVVDISGASDLETVNLTLMYDNDPGNSATTNANNAKDTSSNTNNLTFNALAKLTSVTITGKGHDVTVTSNPLLTTINLGSLTAFDVDVDGNSALSSFSVAGAKLEDVTFDDNDLMTAVTLNHTTTLTGTEKGAKISVTGNAELATLTGGFNSADELHIHTNPKLATLVGMSALTGNGTNTTATVDIRGNALVADLIRDSKEATALTAAQNRQSATDTGSITTSSGIKDLDTYLADAKAATGTVEAWFDTITKLETQAAYGGSYTDGTSSLVAPTAWNDAEAGKWTSGTGFTGYYAYFYSTEDTRSTTVTGAISKERTSATWELQSNALTGAQTTTLGNAEGIIIETPQGDYTFDTGDSYSGAASGGTVSTIADLVGYMTAQTQTNVGSDIDVTAAQDGHKRAIYSFNYIASTGANATAGVVSTLGNLLFSFGTDDDGADKDATLWLTAVLAAGDTVDDIADAVMTAINADGLYAASSAAGGTGNLFYVTKNVSGTSTADNSPMATFPSVVFDTATSSNTAILTPSAYDALISGSQVSTHNTRGTASSFFSLSADAPIVKSGVRVTLQNDGGAGAKFAVADDGMYRTDGHSMYIVGANSNTTMRTNLAKGNKTGTPAEMGYLQPGVNMSTYVASTNETPATYDATFASITAGTSTTTGTDDVQVDRTSW